MFKMVNVMTCANTYDTPLGDKTKGKDVDHPSSFTPPLSSNPLQIYNLIYDATLCPPKSIIQKVTFNPNSHVSQNYNIVEYLVKNPCVMSAL
jgi:hypothetical protein